MIVSAGVPIVSIHASRTGGDIDGIGVALGDWRFNPRLPHGRRHIRKSSSPVQ